LICEIEQRSGRVREGRSPSRSGCLPPLDGTKAREVSGVKRADEMRPEVDGEGIPADRSGPEFLVNKGLADEPLAFAPLAAALGIRIQPQPMRRICPAGWMLGQLACAGVIE
jgi:hypothetical protein